LWLRNHSPHIAEPQGSERFLLQPLPRSAWKLTSVSTGTEGQVGHRLWEQRSRWRRWHRRERTGGHAWTGTPSTGASTRACTATEARNLQATQDGDLRRIHGLQKLMLRSWSNTLIHTSLNCSTVGSGFITRRLNGKRVRRLAVTLMADDPRRCSHAATRHFSQDDDLDDEDSTQQSSRC